MRLFPAVLIIASSLLAGPSGAAQAVVLFVDRANAGDQALGKSLERKLNVGSRLRRIDFDSSQPSNPIAKGRLLASLQSGGLVVSVGDRATEFAARELEQTPIYFVGAALARGSDLQSRELSGMFSYSHEDVLDALPEAMRSGLGLLYTPGYEGVVKKIQSSAQSRGATLQEGKVGGLKALSQATEAMLTSAKAIWVLGDPLLASEAGFQYLVEATLGRDVALIGPGPQQVREGALLCSRSGDDSIAAAAAEDVQRLIADKKARLEARTAPAGGDILYQPALIRKFGLTPLPRWKKID